MYRFTPSILLIGATAGSVALAAGVTANASEKTGHRGATSPYFATSGTAYGSRLHALSSVTADDSARTTIGCSAHPATRQNETANGDLQAAGDVHGVTTTASTTPSESGLQTVTTAHTDGGALLGGLVTYSQLTSTATAVQDPSAPTSGTAQFDDLQIGGKAVQEDPAPNTSYTLPGVATVTVNAQHRTAQGGVQRITVDGMDVTLLQDSQYGAKGTKVVIGRASAALHALRTSPLKGIASGSQVTTDNVTSDPTYQAKIRCSRTGPGETENGAGIHLGQLLHTAAVHTRAVGASQLDVASSTTHSTVHDVNLLSGLVRASTVRARAVAFGTPERRRVQTSGSTAQIENLTIAGHPVKTTTAPNTAKQLPGVGTLWLNRKVTTGRGVEVHALELVLSKARDGFKKGAVIDIANAEAHLGG
jgi:IS5 family transposase